MSIGIICRHCGTRLKVAEKAAGKLGKCPKCKEAIRVPKAVTPEAHFCDNCQTSLASEPESHMKDGKIFCGACYAKLFSKKTGDPIIDQLGLNIPGLVVLRGKEQRQMGRMLKDVTAKKKFKEGDQAAEETPAEVETKEPAPEIAQEPPAAEEPALIEETPAPAPPAAEEPPAVEETPAEEPAVEEAPAPEPPAEPAPKPEPAKLSKGQRPADTKLIELLMESGVVLEGELELALQYQKGIGKRLIPVLDDLKLTSEDEIAAAISKNTGLEACAAGELEIADNVNGLLDNELMGRYEVIPLRHDGDALVAAFPNPLDTDAVKELRNIVEVRIIPRVCTWSQYTSGRKYFKSAH